MDTMKYQNYVGSVEASAEGRCLHGKILFVDDLVTYEGQNFSELEKAFHEAVDDYLSLCSEIGKDPAKPFKGAFNVRVRPDVHRALAVRALADDVALNEVVARACEAYLQGENGGATHYHHHHHEVKVVRWEEQGQDDGDVDTFCVRASEITLVETNDKRSSSDRRYSH